MTNVLVAVIVIGLLVLGYYLGRKVAKLNAEAEVRDEYIKIQAAILGSMVRAVQRGGDLEKFTKKLASVTTHDGLNRLYEEALSGAGRGDTEEVD